MADWVEIKVECAPEALEAVSQFFMDLGAGGTVIHDPFVYERHRSECTWDLVDDSKASDPESGWAVSAYFPLSFSENVRARTDAFLRRLGCFGLEAGPDVRIELRPVSEEDWAENWKSFYPVLHIGQKFVIRPSWLSYAPRTDEIVIDLDPGMAFGTGMHPTTALALELLESALDHVSSRRRSESGAPMPPWSRVIDVGTGSGILAIAAAKMGAAAVVALDADPLAIDVARRNIDRNGVNGIIKACVFAVGGNGIPTTSQAPDAGAGAGCYDLILQNTLAEVIESNLPALAPVLCPGGHVILSGIASGKERAVLDAAFSVGLEVLERKERDGWVGFLLIAGREREGGGRRL